MKILSMFRDIVHSLLSRPATQPYPPEQAEVERLRGIVVWQGDRCTGCQLCVKDCPADALQLIPVEGKDKTYVMRYDLSRCTFCAQCVEACRFDCIQLSSTDWSRAATTREAFTSYYGEEEDVNSIVASETRETD